MVIIWAQSNSPSQTTAYGSDLSADDMQFEKEYWKPRTTFRYTLLTVHLDRSSPDRPFQLYGHAGLRRCLESHGGVHHFGEH